MLCFWRGFSLRFLSQPYDFFHDIFLNSCQDVAMKRVRYLLDLDPEEEALKQGANEVLWAVVAAYTK